MRRRQDTTSEIVLVARRTRRYIGGWGADSILAGGWSKSHSDVPHTDRKEDTRQDGGFLALVHQTPID